MQKTKPDDQLSLRFSFFSKKNPERKTKEQKKNNRYKLRMSKIKGSKTQRWHTNYNDLNIFRKDCPLSRNLSYNNQERLIFSILRRYITS